ncbi:unnamed protein product [Phyllotreta striolata]|uniref:GRIP domain-containing protein n=1 Tax=Phyllotreta striolata TaxID=444603 RepID=A0A9N9XWA0_PHYSR|nr:unnamed protein product [Phyllotreta striolata]
MSGTPFTKPPTRIPVPSSPLPLRRQNSLPARVATPPRSGAGAAHRFSQRESALQSPPSPPRRRSSMEKPAPRPDRVKIAKGAPACGPRSPARLRSLSLSLSNAKIAGNSGNSRPSPVRPITGDSRNFSAGAIDNWDNESLTSVGSVNSIASCDHSSIACNGTTFSGRSMKYVFHCNQTAGAPGDEYLTPTQRAHKQVKKLKHLLQQARKDLDDKDSDILRLTKEVVELRLYKAALGSPEDHSNSSDVVTVRENVGDETTPDGMGAINDLSNSCGDSGHFEDCTSSSVNSKESMCLDDCRPANKPERRARLEKSTSTEQELEHRRIIEEYERRFRELVRTHEEDCLHVRQKHNEKVEELLTRINEINTRYWQMVPELEAAKERIKELEQRLEEAGRKLEEAGSRSQEAVLEGGEALMRHHSKMIELAQQHPSRVSVPELLNELQVTKNELENIRDVEYESTSNNSRPLLSAKEALSLWVLGARKAMYRQLIEMKNKNKIDPEITLQFLKSAVYYFLTDKENSQGHLKAIQSILGFSPSEISNIEKARLT